MRLKIGVIPLDAPWFLLVQDVERETWFEWWQRPAPPPKTAVVPPGAGLGTGVTAAAAVAPVFGNTDQRRADAVELERKRLESLVDAEEPEVTGALRATAAVGHGGRHLGCSCSNRSSAHCLRGKGGG